MLRLGSPEYRSDGCLSSPVTSDHPGTQTLSCQCLWQESVQREREGEGRGGERGRGISLKRSLRRVFIMTTLWTWKGLFGAWSKNTETGCVCQVPPVGLRPEGILLPLLRPHPLGISSRHNPPFIFLMRVPLHFFPAAPGGAKVVFFGVPPPPGLLSITEKPV